MAPIRGTRFERVEQGVRDGLEPTIQQYNQSFTLVITFLLGIAIGGTFMYALADVLELDFRRGVAEAPASDSPAEATAVDPDSPIAAEVGEGAEPEAAPEPANVPEADSLEAQEIAAAADLDGFWPAQHLMLAASGSAWTPEQASAIRDFQPGAFVIEAGAVASTDAARSLVAATEAFVTRGTPIFVVEQEGGTRNPLGADPAPVPQALAEGPGAADAVRATAERYAQAAASVGIGALLGPSLDFSPAAEEALVDPAFTLGSDHFDIGMLGTAFVEGAEAGGALAIAKTYPGLGTAVLEDGWPTLQEGSSEDFGPIVYPFVEVARFGLAGILVGHQSAPAFHENERLPASQSPRFIQIVLRERREYAGLVIADDLRQVAVLDEQTEGDAAVRSLHAGCDLVLVRNWDRDLVQQICSEIVSAAREGVLAPEKIDAAKARIASAAARVETLQADIEVPAQPAPPEPAPEAAPVTESEAPAPEETEAEADETEAEADEVEAEADEVEAAIEVEAAVEPVDETPQVPEVVAQPPGTTAVVHTIERGETLAGIARQYDVSISELEAWNGLASSTIKFGFPITVYVPEGWTPPAPPEQDVPVPEATPEADAAPEPDERPMIEEPEPEPEPNVVEESGDPEAPTEAPEAVSEESVAEEARAEASAPEVQAPTDIEPEAAATPTFVEHTVSRGDTLTSIARRYGISSQDILDANNISNPNRVLLGTTLRIPVVE